MREQVREYEVEQLPEHGRARVTVRQRAAYASLEEAFAAHQEHIARGNWEAAEKAQAAVDAFYEAARIGHAAAGTEPEPGESQLLRAVELADGSGRNLSAREWLSRLKVTSPSHKALAERWGRDDAEYMLAGMNALPESRCGTS